MPEAHLRVDLRDDGSLWLTLDRPEVLNAFSDEMALALAEELEAAHARDDVRAVVVTGAGDAFSAGADISADDAHERLDVRAVEAANRMVRAVTGCAKPVVAGVRGVAAGVGCSIAVAADLQVVAESANFLLAFARIGLMPDGGTSATVAAAVGRPRAMRMALLGEPLTGREAYDAGLVSHLVTDEEHDAALETLVRRLVRGAPLAQSATKRAVNAATLSQLEPALDRERSGQSLLLRTADAAEGMRAFRERRRPEFGGS
ncbi:enoyl-CoA hydratase-related protein [Nocardioides flavescens]|uniref:Enoyl-CoA hydratase n=1 Tax=Nocardioides flavescens TaxID=2691959 RepID=A0A6L7EM47_9ACTN|nr:enoyl-CoA hydratase-related protein [Nocardioides flavescens]MXG88383.1 enoyl-CoA hydratase [Nocardioides flavescens]